MGKVCQSLLIHQVINYLPFGQGIFIAHDALDAKAKSPPCHPRCKFARLAHFFAYTVSAIVYAEAIPKMQGAC